MKILVVSSRFPLPPWRGNQLRTLQWLEALADHERLLVCPADDGQRLPERLGVDLAPMTSSTFAMGVGMAAAVVRGRPAQEGIYDTRGGRRHLMGVLRTWKPDLAVIQMVRCGWAADVIRGLEPGLPVVFDAIDCMAMHYRRAAARGPWPLRLANGFESARCRRRETELVRTATVTTAVSDRDLESLGAGTSGMVVTVTGGLELSGERSDPPQPTVLLSGNLGYRPTVRAACWFADRVWPGIRGAVPGAIWVLAGARPPAAILRLAARPGVEVHGDVDDLAPYLERATVAVAPMAGGSGVPVKILEAMAARVPVVADPWSCSGLADPAAVIGANEPSEWIEVLTRVLTNPEVARRQAASGYEVWRSFYRPERVADQIRAAVASALGP